MILETISPNNLMLKTSLSSKKFTLQFLPEALKSVSLHKKVIFESKNLKTSYIIDIIHNLVLKYYFKKENYFHLNSSILKEKYGHLYNYYIKYLIVNNILVLEKNHLKGVNSRAYSLNDSIIKSEIHRYRNFDKFLLKKYINRFVQFQTDKECLIPIDIKNKIISDLYSVKIQYEKSLFYLNALRKDDISLFNRNKYSVDSINDKHIFYHFDHYGRIHTNFTILKSFIRKNCLLIDEEETSEKDIKNSQPLFLLSLIKKSLDINIDSDEINVFSAIVKNGNYYQYLVDKLRLSDKFSAKELTYKVFFGRNYKNSKYDILFKILFPTIYNFILKYKKDNEDYKHLAYTLQRMESNFIFNEVIKTIMIINPSIRIVTVHDSIIYQNKWKNIVEKVFDEKLEDMFNEF